MSEETGQVLPFGAADVHASQALKKRIGVLVRRFIEERSSETADALVQTLDRLAQQPEIDREPLTQCELSRLRAHWKMISFLAPGA